MQECTGRRPLEQTVPSTRHILHLATLCIALGGAAHADAQRVDFTPGDSDAFTAPGLLQGVRATEAQCAAALPAAVWVRTAGGAAECLRYWHAGLAPGANPKTLFYFSGDVLAGDLVLDPNYTTATPASLQRRVDAWQARLGVPYVFIARPGTYGSSGEHKQRRRALESELISLAVDEIKRRHGIDAPALAGQSGGGHVVAALLTLRADVECAVPASAVSSPRMRWKMKGWKQDSTGYDDSFEPTEALERMRAPPSLRVFVLGDPMDTNVPWVTQTVLADRLKARGVAVALVEAEGSGPTRHGLAQSAMTLAAMCMKGSSTPEILQRAAQRLKG